jgi:cobalt/nickel transport system permease protein
MGVAGAFVGYGVFWLVNRLGGGWMTAAFLAGLLSDWATYAFTSFELTSALSGGSFTPMFASILLAFVPTQLPLGVLEGFLCVGAYGFIRARRVELLSVFEGEKAA